MAFIGFLGNFLVGCGPPAVFFIAFIYPTSLLVLLALASAFYWLLILFIISAIFRGFTPLHESASTYSAAILVSVFIEEVARVGVWILHKRSCSALIELGRQSGGSHLSNHNKHQLAFAWGYGHGAAHTIFLFVSFLGIAFNKGHVYVPQCSEMSVLVVTGLLTLGMFMINSFGTVVYFWGWSTKNWVAVGGIPILHLVAGLLTLVNFQMHGCVASSTLTLIIGVSVATWCALVVWKTPLR
eukprot:TRINITY_DN4111_c0_g1_i1.p1 TRINITY_DN4111_c0_g1~~TRINITY_DN4111_c0_g1_i1.p1  ORF type:complete len:241 (-),score=10.73 TRINITY_DN4111_c0_g1_i1:267-989(-)